MDTGLLRVSSFCDKMYRHSLVWGSCFYNKDTWDMPFSSKNIGKDDDVPAHERDGFKRSTLVRKISSPGSH